MNAVAASQEFIQGLCWLVSLLGCYFSAVMIYRAALRQPEGKDARGVLLAAAIGFALIASCTWAWMGADIIGRLVHPSFFVPSKK